MNLTLIYYKFHNKTMVKKSKSTNTKIMKCGPGNRCCGYFLGFLGAAIYYISAANGFWMGVLGFLKALVWPAFLVFEVLKFLGA